MLKIIINLSEDSYQKLMSNFLLNRPNFKIISFLLILLVGISTGLVIFDLYQIDMVIIMIWWGLVILYFFLIPYFIYFRTKNIYRNTNFLQNEMSLEINQDKIVWITSGGTKKTAINSMYKITTTTYGLILSFSPYQILPIPYDSIPKEIWEQIMTYLSTYKKNTLTSKYFYKHNKSRGNHE